MISKRMKILVDLFVSMTKNKDEDLYVFGSWFGKKFADNPKYLYLYFLSQGMNAVWITQSIDVYEDLIARKMPVFMENSEEGKRACQTAKYAFYCVSPSDISERYIGGAVMMDLWHGLPFKKVMRDDNINYRKNFRFRIWDILTRIPKGNMYLFTSSDGVSRIYKHAFNLSDDRILQYGQPRNDAFFNGLLEKKKYSDIPYKKVISYMPTHRNEGHTPIDCSTIFDLKKINDFCKENEILFIIKKHFYHKSEQTELEGYSNIIDLTNSDIDTQELLYNTDLLICDYSSTFIDYLLLDRPIVFYCFDYEQYLSIDRGMYFDYESVTPGAKVQKCDELIVQLDRYINDQYDYSDIHNKVKNMFYAEENQHIVSDRILNMVKTRKF